MEAAFPGGGLSLETLTRSAGAVTDSGGPVEKIFA